MAAKKAVKKSPSKKTAVAQPVPQAAPSDLKVEVLDPKELKLALRSRRGHYDFIGDTLNSHPTQAVVIEVPADRNFGNFRNYLYSATRQRLEKLGRKEPKVSVRTLDGERKLAVTLL